MYQWNIWMLNVISLITWHPLKLHYTDTGLIIPVLKGISQSQGHCSVSYLLQLTFSFLNIISLSNFDLESCSASIYVLISSLHMMSADSIWRIWVAPSVAWSSNWHSASWLCLVLSFRSCVSLVQRYIFFNSFYFVLKFMNNNIIVTQLFIFLSDKQNYRKLSSYS